MAEKDPPDDDVYDLSALAIEGEIPTEWNSGAVYTLEGPARCPYCREPLRSLRVLRLTRTQVSFTSTLPRGGKAIICPQCERIISAEVGGLI